MSNKEYIRQLANFLIQTETTMNAENLAEHLNWNNFKTTYDTEYEGGRGTYRLIHTTYDWLTEKGLKDEAENVAKAFKKPNGGFAYE